MATDRTMTSEAEEASGSTVRLGRPPALSPEARREALIAAAGRVFMRAGFAAATMEKIASEAGMSKRTLYRFFPDKRAALEAFLSDHDRRLHLPPYGYRPGDDPRDELRAVLSALGDYLLAPEQLALTRVVIAEAPKFPELAESFERLEMSGAARRVTTRLQRLAEDAGLDADRMAQRAELMIGALFGPLHVSALASSPGTPRDPAVLATRIDMVMDEFAPILGLRSL